MSLQLSRNQITRGRSMKINTKLTRFAIALQHFATGLTLLAVCRSPILAQDAHSHTPPAQSQELTRDDQTGADTLLKIVRRSTERFKDVAVAEGEGYALQFGCVAGDDDGAMGLHYVNPAILGSGILDPTRPQIVIYEPI